LKVRSLVVLGSMVMAGLTVAAPGAHADEGTDTTAPVGTYTVSRTIAYLMPQESSTGVSRSVSVQLTQTSLDDPTATRQVFSNTGAAPVAWPTGTTFPLVFTQPGTYKPQVRLSDGAGNVSTVVVGTVTVLLDKVAPKLTIATPKKASKAASWRVVRGTATDVGTGVAAAAVFVMQKRGKVWWAYDFGKKKWLKGYSTVAKTEARSKASPAYVPVKANGAWASPAIKGLKKGSTVIEAAAFDYEYNVGETHVGPRKLG
jgi:hypothetical protein